MRAPTPSPSSTLAPSSPAERDRGWARELGVLVAGLGMGLALGLQLAPERASPTTAAVVPVQPAEESFPAEASPTPLPIDLPTERPSEPGRESAPRAELAAALEVNEGELRALARALSDPTAYRHVRAVLADLESYDAAARRRDELYRAGGEPAPALPPLPPGLRERAHELSATRASVLVLPVDDVARGVEVVAADVGETATAPRPGVVLANDGPRRTVTFRTRASGVERTVSISEDPQAGCDRLRVTFAAVGGPVTFARSSRLSGPAGKAWQDLIAFLWERGSVPFVSLESLVSGGDAALPSRRGGWIDWVRRHVGLPANPELHEPSGPPLPLPADNPLLLVGDPGDAQPTLLERPDLELDPDGEQPPLLSPARGPLVLLARNGVGVFDGGWRWLVFDPERARAVEHLPDAGPGGGHVRWELFPDPERSRLGRGAELSRALAQLTQERTRQALALILLRREAASLEREMEGRIGGMYTADGLAALRLHDEVVDRHRRLQALSHLLLDAEGAARSDRELEEARRRAVGRLVSVIEAQIEAGRAGPAEYLLREDRIKAILLQAPQAHRLRLCQAFRDEFRPWHRRLVDAFAGGPRQWYEVE